MYLSAVILTYNSERHIGACLQSLQSALECLPMPCEIFVVDNGSSDQTRSILENFETTDGLTLHTILLARNEGTTVARNKALRRASGDYILILDADVVVPADGLEPLIRHLEQNPRAGLVAPRLAFPDGRPQLSVDRFPTIGRKLTRALFLRSMEADLAQGSAAKKPRSVDYAVSAFWLLPRHTIEAVGPLDERFFYAPEDVDYCLSVWLAGFTVDYDPAVTAIHDATERSRGWRMNAFTVRHMLGLARYFLKWRYGFGLKRVYHRIAQARLAATARPASIPET